MNMSPYHEKCYNIPPATILALCINLVVAYPMCTEMGEMAKTDLGFLKVAFIDDQ